MVLMSRDSSEERFQGGQTCTRKEPFPSVLGVWMEMEKVRIRPGATRRIGPLDGTLRQEWVSMVAWS